MTRDEIIKQFDKVFERHQWSEDEIENMIDFAEICVAVASNKPTPFSSVRKKTDK